MKIVIAGYRGLIGHAVAQALKQYPSLTLGRDACADIRCDLSLPETLDTAAFKETGLFIHAAGIVDEDLQGDNTAPAILRATQGIQALLRKLAQAGVKHMMYVSSAHVYGLLEGTITEQSPVNPQSLYGLMHYCAEQLIAAAVRSGGLQSAVILRPNAVYGMPPEPARFRRWSLIPFSFPREAMEKQAITLKSDGLQRRNFISTRSIGQQSAHQVARLLQNEVHGISIINPLGPETLSVIEFARRIAALYAKRTGIACEVRSPKAAGKTPVFAYGSEQDFQPPGQPLNDFINELFGYIEKSHAA